MQKRDFETYQKRLPRFRDPPKIFRDPRFPRYHYGNCPFSVRRSCFSGEEERLPTGHVYFVNFNKCLYLNVLHKCSFKATMFKNASMFGGNYFSFKAVV